MIFDDHTKTMEKVYNESNYTLEDIGVYFDGVITRSHRNTFFSRGVPGVKNSRWIVFVYYKNRIGFFLKYDNGDTLYSDVEKPSDVFTPNVMNLENMTLLSKEDAAHRAQIQ